MLSTVDFESDEAVDHPFFLLDSTSECFPSAAALQAAAIEKFELECREEEPADVGRIAALEAQIKEMKDGLNLLIAGQSKMQVDAGSGFQTAAEDANKSNCGCCGSFAASSLGYLVPKLHLPHKLMQGVKNPPFAGLDPGTVAEAFMWRLCQSS